ncbi:hypothetical protein [Vibrio sp. TRT 1302]
MIRSFRYNAGTTLATIQSVTDESLSQASNVKSFLHSINSLATTPKDIGL